MRGGDSFTRRTSSRNGSRTGSIITEWKANDPAASTFAGTRRELLRFAHVVSTLTHPLGAAEFNPTARPGSEDYGLLYTSGSDLGFSNGGPPNNNNPGQVQRLDTLVGAILRIDPRSPSVSKGVKGLGDYTIPPGNKFAADNDPKTLGEIYAYGVRNPQRLSWDSKDRKMYVADIGQNIVEEISPVTAGANLGWNVWEASFKYVNRQVDVSNPRSDPAMTWPVAEYDHTDPLLNRTAITGVYVYRQGAVKQLLNLMLFGDNPSGEIFYVNADKLPNGGQDQIRRVLFDDNGTHKTLLQLIRAKNAAQGKPPAARADLRFGRNAGNQIFIMNKRDGVVRVLIP